MELEARVAALGKQVARLSAGQTNGTTESHAWIDKILGIFRDNQEFEEAVKAGKEWRRTQPY
jgi:hypothetical protein